MPYRGAYLLSLLGVVACQAVLGIEDAEVDPSLSQPAQVVDDGGVPDGMPPPNALSTCERYCETVTQTCAGEFAQYTTVESCLGVCELLPEGTDGDTSGNTVFCRLQAAGQAPLEPSFYCPVAGPGGNGVCGTNCEGLCSLVQTLCSDNDKLPADCLGACAELPDTEVYSVAPDLEVFKGKQVQCRLYHASVATETDTEQHCQHALGGSPCD
ncbi:MAG TPA: hypothetical protein VM686_30360 [Polyangiaceae bacterium]|nr:hypothetical protein [Polyangiaceae bacterium]